MSITKILSSMIPVVDAFEELGVTYYIGGSVASLAHGIYRATADVDIIADLRIEHVQPLVKLLEDAYYIDADMIRDAIKHRSEFNVLHLDTMFKVDVFIQKARPFDREVRRRAQQRELNLNENSRLFNLESPEDVILSKLEWFRLGDEVSDKQWIDITKVLAVQQHVVDRDYMAKWAAELGVADLLERAWKEVPQDA